MSFPNGYQVLEYIESTGTQYIDTGYVPHCYFLAQFEMTETPTEQSAWVFGSYASSSNRFDLFWNYVKQCFQSGVNNLASFSTNLAATKKCNVMKLGSRCLLSSNDYSTSATNTYETKPTGVPMYLFGYNSNNTGAKGLSKMRLYFCKIFSSGEPARDFIPCRTPNGEIGLYDLANGTFYGNDGSGEFIAGPVLWSAPLSPEEEYSRNSFLAGLAVGRRLKGWVKHGKWNEPKFVYSGYFRTGSQWVVRAEKGRVISGNF